MQKRGHQDLVKKQHWEHRDLKSMLKTSMVLFKNDLNKRSIFYFKIDFRKSDVCVKCVVFKVLVCEVDKL